MLTEILISIHPKHCYNIATGEKKLEMRKSKPKDLKPPFKCYIYCTLQKERFSLGDKNYAFADNLYRCNGKLKYGNNFDSILYPTVPFNGYVIGEFICDAIYQVSAHKTDELHGNGFITCDAFGPYFGSGNKVLKDACITGEEALKYLGNNMTGFAWHISDLVIYDESKELCEFTKEEVLPLEEIEGFSVLCDHCSEQEYNGYNAVNNTWYNCGHGNCHEAYEEYKKALAIKRPPQSWQFVTSKKSANNGKEDDVFIR